MIVVGRSIVDWVESQLGEVYEGGEGLGLLINGHLKAGIVYNHFAKNGCHIHVASISPYWFTKEFAEMIFSVPFKQWNYERLTAPIYADNAKSRNFVERIGFVHEGTLRGERPVCIYGLLKKECKYV